MRKGPVYVQLYPTLRCNQSCGFCFNRFLPPVKEMSLDDCLLMLSKLHDAGVTTIDIMGGEPTLHPAILQIIREAGSFSFHLNISSNGTRTAVLEEILRLDAQVTVGVSVNDGETLRRTEGFIRKHRTIVKSVFTASLDSSLISRILALQPERYYLLYRDAMNADELPDALPFDRFLSSVAALTSAGQLDTVSCSGFLPDTATYPELDHVRCPAGTTKLGIMPDGSVYPCNLFFRRAEFLLGNILVDPWDSIWQNERLAFFRSFSGNVCPRIACELHSRCHGGCPAHSVAYGGLPSEPDPRCWER